MKLIKLLCLTCLSASAYAGDMGAKALNQSGYYLGFGGAYNAANWRSTLNLSLYASSGVPPLGQFWGRFGASSGSNQSIAPQLQVGYLQSFASSPTLWGVELVAQFTNVKLNNSGNRIRLTNLLANTTDDISVSVLSSTLKELFVLPAYIGRTWGNGSVFLGVGPSLFRLQYKGKHIFDGLSGNYLGLIDSFSQANWVFGGALQTGAIYHFAPTWFIKLNYLLAATGNYNVRNAIDFSPALNHGLNSGRLTYQWHQQITVQEAAISINKLF